MLKLVTYKYLKTNSVVEFDNFVVLPNVDNLKALNEDVLRSVTKLQQFDGKFLILTLSVLSKVYEASTDELTLNCARILCDAFFKNASNLNSFPDEFLTQLGFIKVGFFNFFKYLCALSFKNIH